ncbi:MAG: hypothetical protein QOH00_833 [Gaiellales bacterium]|jgi:hypothetical protein|nr:hypothetical protein [Gaiellales bacterium]
MTTRRVSEFRRFLAALAGLALVGVVLAGCGSAGKASAVAGAAGTDGRAAQAYPASTVAFADANIDEQSDAWKRLLALGARFPSWPKLLTEFDKSANQATDGGPTFAQVRSWLGSEVAVGVLDVPTDGSDPLVLGFAEVSDRSGLEGALKQEKDVQAAGTHGGFDLFQDTKKSTVVGVSDDTALVANSQAVVNAAIDRLSASSDRLSDSTDFKDTLATLPSDNLVVAYAPGSTLQKLVTLAQTRGPAATQGQVPQAQVNQISAKLAGIRSLGFSLGATDKGLRARGTTLLNGQDSGLPAAFSPDLLRRVPASSWFAASFGNLDASIKQAADQALTTNASAQKQVAQVEALLGVKLDDVYALLSGDQALYAGPGAPLSAGLILHPADAAKGAATLRTLTKLLTSQGITFTDTADGQKAAIQGFVVHWRAVDDVIGIGSDAAVGDSAKDSIVDSDKYKRVLAEDGVGGSSKTLGLAYIDVPSLVNLATAFGAFNGASGKETVDNLRHVGGVLFWTGRDGDTVTSDVFVEST